MGFHYSVVYLLASGCAERGIRRRFTGDFRNGSDSLRCSVWLRRGLRNASAPAGCPRPFSASHLYVTAKSSNVPKISGKTAFLSTSSQGAKCLVVDNQCIAKVYKQYVNL